MKRHLLTLSFDDGFRDSCVRIAAIHERLGLSACLNVLASGGFGGQANDLQQGFPKGDFVLWNELAARGHEIMPHGWNHTHKPSLPHAQAQDLIRRCLDTFAERLHGFAPRRAVFNFPYNASTPALDAWLPGVVRAFRVGDGAMNPLPTRQTVRITSDSFGPGTADATVDAAISRLLASERGWLVFCLHGLDQEGWGPVSATWLERTLTRLRTVDSLDILPAGRVLTAVDAAAAEAR
jgi:peptidoglycan/xylan/chitin deacetylase (PgdA/CDA1 family)